jgi:hypothetical protein
MVNLGGLGVLWWGFESEEASATGGNESSVVTPSTTGGPLAETLPAEVGDVLPSTPSPFQGAEPTKARGAGTEVTEASGATRYLSGRVVDDRRYPRDGVEVLVIRNDLPVGRARTAGGGRFRVAAGPVPEHREDPILIHAADPRVGAVVVRRYFPEGGSAKDVGTLVLGEAHDLHVLVVKAGAPVPGARVVCCSQGQALQERAADASGEVVFRHLPSAASWHVFATDPRGARGVARAPLPREEPGPLEVTLLDGHDLRVTVVDAKSGTPIAGARVVPWTMSAPGQFGFLRMVTGAPPPRTDTQGATVVRAIQAWDSPFIEVRATGFFGPGRSRFVSIGRGQKHRRVALEPVRRVSWPVSSGELPSPTDGEVIRFRQTAGTFERYFPNEGRMSDGRIVVEGFEAGSWSAMAVAPDGGLAPVFISSGDDTGPETTFRIPRRVEVVVRDTAREPVRGMVIEVRKQGRLIPPHAATDGEGRALLDGFWGELVDVYMGSFSGSRQPAVLLGTLDLERGDGKLEVEIGAERIVVLDVSIDGERRLPATFDISVSNGHTGLIEEDAARGTVRFAVRPHDPAEPMSVTMSAPDSSSLTATIPLRSPGEEIRLPMALAGATTLLVELIAPQDSYCMLSHQRWDEKTGTWISLGQLIGLNGREEIHALPKGRYRILDVPSGVTTEDIEVSGGAGVLETRLDLSQVGWVRGQVLLPESADPRQTRIRCSGEGIAFVDKPTRHDGGFAVRVPGGRPVKLSAWHPLSRPHPERAAVTLTGPRDDILLELLGRSRARFRTRSQLSSYHLLYEKHRVLLYRGEPGGVPLAEHALVPEDGALVFGGFEPGTYTLWIDVPTHTPLILRDVTLGEGETDLGTLTLDPGIAVRVGIPTEPGATAPRITISAESRQDPVYHRHTNSYGETEAVLQGLGPGRFKVRIGLIKGDPQETVHEITVDGNSDVRLLFDPR